MVDTEGGSGKWEGGRGRVAEGGWQTRRVAEGGWQTRRVAETEGGRADVEEDAEEDIQQWRHRLRERQKHRKVDSKDTDTE